MKVFATRANFRYLTRIRQWTDQPQFDRRDTEYAEFFLFTLSLPRPQRPGLGSIRIMCALGSGEISRAALEMTHWMICHLERSERS